MSDIFSEDYSKFLPPVLAADETVAAIATATAEKLLEVSKNIKLVSVYSRIDSLDENTLDVLAQDFQAEWYDSSAPVEVKRNIIKNAFKVHKYVGTPYAVRCGIKSLFDDVEIIEWFDYGAAPFHFKIEILKEEAATESEKAKVNRVINFFKNQRSVLDAVNFIKRKKSDVHVYAGAPVYSTKKTITTEVQRNELG